MGDHCNPELRSVRSRGPSCFVGPKTRCIDSTIGDVTSPLHSLTFKKAKQKRKLVLTPGFAKRRTLGAQMASHSERDFFFEGVRVGYFEDVLPSSPGVFRYMPYRGYGHWRLGEALASHSQSCYYVSHGKKHHFTLARIVSYGLLEVSHTD